MTTSTSSKTNSTGFTPTWTRSSWTDRWRFLLSGPNARVDKGSSRTKGRNCTRGRTSLPRFFLSLLCSPWLAPSSFGGWWEVHEDAKQSAATVSSCFVPYPNFLSERRQMLLPISGIFYHHVQRAPQANHHKKPTNNPYPRYLRTHTHTTPNPYLVYLDLKKANLRFHNKTRPLLTSGLVGYSLTISRRVTYKKMSIWFCPWFIFFLFWSQYRRSSTINPNPHSICKYLFPSIALSSP